MVVMALRRRVGGGGCVMQRRAVAQGRGVMAARRLLHVSAQAGGGGAERPRAHLWGGTGWRRDVREGGRQLGLGNGAVGRQAEPAETAYEARASRGIASRAVNESRGSWFARVRLVKVLFGSNHQNFCLGQTPLPVTYLDFI